MHLLPGRLRLKSDPLRGDLQNAETVQDDLATIKGVHEASVNVVTGSITVLFDPDVTSGHAIINFLIDEQWIENVIPFPERKVAPVITSKAALAQTAVAAKGSGQALARRNNSHLINKVALTAVKIVLPLIVERYIGKSASKFVSSIL